MRFFLWADPEGRAFRFAPLGGDTFQALVSAAERERLPDSLVVRASGGALLTRSTGVLHAMKRLGGVWRAMAVVLAIVPRPIRDLVYDFIAGIRFRLFAKPKDACPFVPPPLRDRFRP